MNKVYKLILIQLVFLCFSFSAHAYNIYEYFTLPEMIKESDHIAVGVVTGNMSLGRYKFSNVTIVHTIKGEAQDMVTINTQDNTIVPEIDCCSLFSIYLFFTSKDDAGVYSVFNADRSVYRISKGKVLNFKGTDKDLDEVILYLKNAVTQ